MEAIINTENITKEIRKELIKMHQKGPHIGPAFSVVDIIAVLYFDIMNISSPDDPARDRFILSKGHASSVLYTTLAFKGFYDKSLLDGYLTDNSVLFGHPKRKALPGIEASTGSLGQGLSLGVGIALAAKNDNEKYKTYVVIGDGECQEGQIWEAAMLASKLKLDNLVVVVDANNLQGYDRVENIQPINTFKAKWEAFGWSVKETNGHDINKLKEALQATPFESGKPSIVIARTMKGKGIAEFEDDLKWHYFLIPKDKVDSYLEELSR
ncbi:MAG: transketolase subunit A [uncultured bacterium]|nr:MAG: transketolase subunit A [uncultured bacterium]